MQLRSLKLWGSQGSGTGACSMGSKVRVFGFRD